MANRPKRNVTQPERYRDLNQGLDYSTPRDPRVSIDLTEESLRHRDDVDDAEITVQTPHRRTTTTQSPKKTRPEDMSRDELLALYRQTFRAKDNAENTTKEIRAKRRVDRKEREKEKAWRKVLQETELRLRDEVTDLQRKRQQEKDDYLNATQQLKDDYAKAQQDLTSQIDARKPYPYLPDNRIRSVFTELYTRCKDWTRQWVTEDFVENHRSAEVLRCCCRPENPMLLARLSSKLKADRTQATRILGFAWLARWIQDVFLCDPFFLLTKRQKTSLEKLYALFKEDDPKCAYEWRAITMRILRAHFHVQPLETRHENLKSTYVKDVCMEFAQDFIGRVDAQVLHECPKDEPEKHIRELGIICVIASLLSLELWCQKSAVVTLNPDDLFSEPFSHDSELHEAYVGMGLEDDDTKFDGWKVQFAIVPPIGMLGDADGNNLATWKTLVKSHVVMFQEYTKNAIIPSDEATLPEHMPSHFLQHGPRLANATIARPAEPPQSFHLKRRHSTSADSDIKRVNRGHESPAPKETPRGIQDIDISIAYPAPKTSTEHVQQTDRVARYAAHASDLFQLVSGAERPNTADEDRDKVLKAKWAQIQVQRTLIRQPELPKPVKEASQSINEVSEGVDELAGNLSQQQRQTKKETLSSKVQESEAIRTEEFLDSGEVFVKTELDADDETRVIDSKPLL